MTTTTAMRDFMQTVRDTGEPDAAFTSLNAIVDELIGTRLLTASVFDMAAAQSRRVFSQNPQVYPVGGFKPIAAGNWADIVLVRQQIFSTLTIEQIAEVFFDWELIASLGCQSNANIPIVVGGAVIGTLNLLHEAGYYTPERLSRAGEIVPYATIAFLLAQKAIPAAN